MNLITALDQLPLWRQIKGYQPGWLRLDLAAGLSIAAVSLPSAIAYPAIAQLPIETGLFAAVFAMIGYALTGPSRQLMVGPDTATCIMLASVIGALGATVAEDRALFAQSLAILVGVVCLGAGLLRFGMVANFLSRPMLVGFLIGISISLIIGQFTRLTGVPIESRGLLRPIIELLGKFEQVHIPTLIMALSSLLFIRLAQRLLPSLPAPLLAISLAIAASAAFGLQEAGIAVLGQLPAVSFSISLPAWHHLDLLPDLVGGAIAITIVGFGSGIVTARSFAMKSRVDVDANRELIGFGGANISSGLFGGFPVTASDSRTAVNFAIGGKTQVAALVAAGGLAAAILFIGDLLAFLPTATLGAILISAAIDLIDLKELNAIRRINQTEFAFALVTVFGVVIVGVLQGVFLAIAVTLAQLLWTASYPRTALLGRLPGQTDLVKLHKHPEAVPVPGMVIVMVQSAILFFNADYLKQRLQKIALARRAETSWFVIDASAINMLDSTAVAKLEELRLILANAGIRLCFSELNSQARTALRRAGLADRLGQDMLFGSTEAAIDAFTTKTPARRDQAVPANDWKA